MTALVPLGDPTDLDRYADPGQFVELACARAKEWLVQAIENGDIDNIVELKSQAEAIRTYTAQKQLGKDAELAAAEIVRRAERGLGIAVKRGQEQGTVQPQGVRRDRPGQHILDPNVLSPSDVLPGSDERTDAYALAEADDDTFEKAIEDAKAENNLSRANVVRKVKGDNAENRIAKARKMAQQGYTSRQIADTLGIVDFATFRKRHSIDVPADAAVPSRTRRHDANRIVEQAVIACEGLAMTVDLIDFNALDETCIEGWATSLSNSLRSLNRLNKQLKEMSRD